MKTIEITAAGAAHESGSTDQPQIPDFVADGICLEKYENTRKRWIARLLDNTRHTVETLYVERVTAAKARVAATYETMTWKHEEYGRSAAPYRQRYPHRTSGGIHQPSFFEVLFSFGRARRMYLAADAARIKYSEAKYNYERANRWLEGQAEWLARVLRDSIARAEAYVETAEWLEKFHEYPEIVDLCAQVRAINEERETYATRLKNGDVGPEEARDRYMAEKHITPLRIGFDGIAFTDVVEILGRAYFIVTDLDGKEYWLPYVQALEPLTEFAIGSYRVLDNTEVQIRQFHHGRQMTVRDHYILRCGDALMGTARWRDRSAVFQVKRAFSDTPCGDEEMNILVQQLRSLSLNVAYGPPLLSIAS